MVAHGYCRGRSWTVRTHQAYLSRLCECCHLLPLPWRTQTTSLRSRADRFAPYDQGHDRLIRSSVEVAGCKASNDYLLFPPNSNFNREQHCWTKSSIAPTSSGTSSPSAKPTAIKSGPPLSLHTALNLDHRT